MKKTLLTILCYITGIAIVLLMIYGIKVGVHFFPDNRYEDGIEMVDPNKISLKSSGVEVEFSDVILSSQEEERKLIVSTQEAEITYELTDRLIKKLDFDILKKTQKVTYKGTGYFVVDLDKLTKDSIIQDAEAKTVTILIDHAYLEDIEIDQNKIKIGNTNEGLLARGDIKLTVSDLVKIQKEIQKRLKEKFNTSENGQKADEIALNSVKEIYEPIIKAIDKNYSVEVKFHSESEK